MKKISAIIITLAILLSLALPVSAGAVEKVTGVKQIGASNSSFEVSWGEYYGAQKYKVEWCNTPNGEYTVDSQYETDYKDTVYNRYAGTTYYVRITPYVNGSWLNSATSNPVAVNTAPNKPSDLVQKKCTESSATFSWQGSLGATGYKIYTYSNGTETLAGSSTTTSFTLKKLSNKGDLSFSSVYVRAVRNTAGFDAQSDYAYFSSYNLKLIPQKCATPKISSYYHYLNKLYFQTPYYKYRDGYQFKIYKGSSKKVAKTLNDKTDVSNLKKGQVYRAKVRAYTNLNNSKVYGKWSNFLYFSSGINDLRVKSKTTSSVKIAWKKVTGAKAKYDIFVSTKYNSGLKKFKKNFKGTSINVTKCGKKRLSRNTYYYFYVKPKVKVGKKFKATPITSYIGQYTNS